MNGVDRFAIPYLVQEISTFKESQHHVTTTATVKIVTLISDLKNEQWLSKYSLESTETPRTESS